MENQEMMLWNAVTFLFGVIAGGIGLWLRTYLKCRAEDTAKHTAYPVRCSEQKHERLTDYKERMMFEKFESIISVRVRLGEIVAVLEKRLPDSVEAREMEKELDAIAVETRALGNNLYVHCGFYDDDMRHKMTIVVERLRALAKSIDGLSLQIHAIDEAEDELLTESMTEMKRQLHKFEVDLSGLAKALKDSATPKAIDKQNRKRLLS